MSSATLPRRGAAHAGDVRSGARRAALPVRAGLALVALLAALSLVTWRQARALEVLGDLARVRQERALAVAEHADLQRRIQYLESRGRTVPAARERLGMHTPEAAEMVILPGTRP